MTSEFSGKDVLIVGGGESASDICLGVARVANSICLSVRGKHGVIVPRMLNDGIPLDFDTSRIHYSLPVWFGGVYSVILFLRFLLIGTFGSFFSKAGSEKKQYYEVLKKFSLKNLKSHCNTYTKFGTKNTSMFEAIVKWNCQYQPAIESIHDNVVTFKNGDTFKCDTIILATGYKNSFPFLSEHFTNIAEDAMTSRKLYKHAIHPNIGKDFFWSGFARPAFGSIMPMSELQARWCALLSTNKLNLPSQDEMRKTIAIDIMREEKQFKDDASRISSLTDYLTYLDEIAEIIGCYPPLVKLFWTDNILWWRIMLGPIIGLHYRLVGPGCREDAREKILKTPIIWHFGLHLVVFKAFFYLFSWTGLPIFKSQTKV